MSTCTLRSLCDLISTMPDRRRANVIGLGVIGASVGLALAERGWHVSGFDIDPDRMKEALGASVCETGGIDSDAEISFVAVPALEVVAAVKNCLDCTSGVVTDVSSVKAPVVDKIDNKRFIAGHPMAGSEQEGISGADPTMFVGATWVLTPTESTDDQTFADVSSVVRSFGADVVALPPQQHDEMVAMVSHVPHLAAAALMQLAGRRADDHSALLRLAAGGFRDMTRVAAGHPAIWPDICAENRIAIVDVLDSLIERLGSVRSIVADVDRSALLAMLHEARMARMNLPGSAHDPEHLVEVRTPIPDRPGSAAEVFTLAAELGVNIYDFEVAHSPEGDYGVMIMVIDLDSSELFRGGLIARGFRPGLRSLE